MVPSFPLLRKQSVSILAPETARLNAVYIVAINL